MMEVMCVAILVFLVLNTVSFYILDYVTERLTIEKSGEMTQNELCLYSFVRILTKITSVVVCATILVNLVNSIIVIISNM
jgi:hypothetical protein